MLLWCFVTPNNFFFWPFFFPIMTRLFQWFTLSRLLRATVFSVIFEAQRTTAVLHFDSRYASMLSVFSKDITTFEQTVPNHQKRHQDCLNILRLYQYVLNDSTEMFLKTTANDNISQGTHISPTHSHSKSAAPSLKSQNSKIPLFFPRSRRHQKPPLRNCTHYQTNSKRRTCYFSWPARLS